MIVTPAVALLAGGSATAAGTGGSSRQLVKTPKLNRTLIHAENADAFFISVNQRFLRPKLNFGLIVFYAKR
ncbi:MAG TPA: hypothetical protein PLA27_10500 [Anaerolineales bacterium]|nr:hypothetical protein [Anaerolineales bacterium]HQX16840.1 hypothetical protein [Anaerolineales bacterium]